MDETGERNANLSVQGLDCLEEETASLSIPPCQAGLGILLEQDSLRDRGDTATVVRARIVPWSRAKPLQGWQFLFLLLRAFVVVGKAGRGRKSQPPCSEMMTDGRRELTDGPIAPSSEKGKRIWAGIGGHRAAESPVPS